MNTENYILEVKNGKIYFNGLVSARSLEILTDAYKGIQESKNPDNSKYWDELASPYTGHPIVGGGYGISNTGCNYCRVGWSTYTGIPLSAIKNNYGGIGMNYPTGCPSYTVDYFCYSGYKPKWDDAVYIVSGEKLVYDINNLYEPVITNNVSSAKYSYNKETGTHSIGVNCPPEVNCILRKGECVFGHSGVISEAYLKIIFNNCTYNHPTEKKLSDEYWQEVWSRKS